MRVRKKLRIDANTKEVREAVERVGGCWIDCTGDPTIGFDALVGFRGRLYPVEVKDGAKPPSERKLTVQEMMRAHELQLVGVEVLVVLSGVDCLRQIGAIK